MQFGASRPRHFVSDGRAFHFDGARVTCEAPCTFGVELTGVCSTIAQLAAGTLARVRLLAAVIGRVVVSHRGSSFCVLWARAAEPTAPAHERRTPAGREAPRWEMSSEGPRRERVLNAAQLILGKSHQRGGSVACPRCCRLREPELQAARAR